MTPTWILDILAGLMLAVAAVSAARLGLARPWRRGAAVTDTDVSHLLMGIAMAGMLVSALTTLPNGAWEGCFAVLIAWFGYRVVLDLRSNGVRALAGGHYVPHLAHSAAMLYMFLALTGTATGGSGMGGMGGSAGQTLRYPTLAFAFALILVGYTIWDIDQLSGKWHRRVGPSLALAGVPVLGVPALAGAELASLGSAATAPGLTAQTAETRTTPTATVSEATAPGAITAGRAGRAAWLLSADITVDCRIAMGATMAFMLLIMI